MAKGSTKHLIAETYFELAEKKPMDKISITELVKACDISRQAFYYHFEDINAVIEWVVQEGVDQALASSLEEVRSIDSLELFIERVYHFRQIINRLLDSDRRLEMEEILIKAIRQLILAMVRQRSEEIQVPLNQLELLVNYHTYGVVGVLVEEMKKPTFDSSKLAKQIYQLMQAE
ncbi:TetR/AcrR family transcriptional regulator C-terminal domain-containing protein [Aerococcaceae bacterium DSM 111176]|nr:TetR/AcrR family transcriptional regulator C-terminal domain-containing protein [Aerococcaceae bacterium DSM 111176]